MKKMVYQHNTIKSNCHSNVSRKAPYKIFPQRKGGRYRKQSRRLKCGGKNLQPLLFLSSFPPIKLDSCTKEGEENSRKNPWLNWRKEEGEGEESITTE